MIGYDEMKALVKRRIVIPDGYSGDLADVGVAYYWGKAYCVGDNGTMRGYYQGNNEEYMSESDLLYCLDTNLKKHFPTAVRCYAATEPQPLTY